MPAKSPWSLVTDEMMPFKQKKKGKNEENTSLDADLSPPPRVTLSCFPPAGKTEAGSEPVPDPVPYLKTILSYRKDGIMLASRFFRIKTLT